MVVGIFRALSEAAAQRGIALLPRAEEGQAYTPHGWSLGLTHRTGCPVLAGREEDGLMAPASLEFHVAGVDQDALAAYVADHQAPRFRDLIADLREKGEWPFPYDIFISVQ